MKYVVFAFCVVAAGAAMPARAQQVTDPNPAHAPSAEIDNKRPLISHKEKAPTTRTVSGKVVDEISGTPLKGAIVTLTDLSTHEKRETITKDDGRYTFDDLSFSIDYELKAKYKDSVTDTRKLSQYDHTAKVVRILNVPDTSAPSTAVSEAKKDTKPEEKK